MLEASQQASSHLNTFDVTGCVDVTQVSDVCTAALDILRETYRDTELEEQLLSQAFRDFERLFTGEYPGYHSCDTLYHDMQHTLDMSLAMARLLNAHEQACPESAQGRKRFVFGMIVALFHDAGYIRQIHGDTASNGAAYTLSHVTRSGRFLRTYLNTLGTEWGSYSDLAAVLVHFTGYEVPVEEIKTRSALDRKLGYLLGTADLLAQLSDRCYLEKCRDRLYPEFVLGGLAVQGGNSTGSDAYTSAENLLERTPNFFQASVMVRLDQAFEKTYELEEVFFDGNTPYMNAIRKNIAHLETLIEKGSFDELRREPPETQGEKAFPYPESAKKENA